MNPIEELKKEHELIERELIELEEIMKAEEINCSNLVHVYKKLIPLWNNHEAKEEKIFPIIEKQEIKIPVEKMMFEHKELRALRLAIKDSMNSGSEIKMKETLNNEGIKMINKLREHMNKEDEILFRITLDLISVEELNKLGEYKFWKKQHRYL